MKLSKRLSVIASFIKGFKSLADIACDHGYLGIYAALNYDLETVLLTDINELPLASAKANITKFSVTDKVNTALGNGLEPLDKDYEVISISGIGGSLLVDILNNDLEKAKKAKRLILSANNDVKLLREFLMNNHFMITSEVMVYDYKYYEILVAEYTSKNVNYTELELKYGPYLLKEKSADFINHYQKLLKTLENQLTKVNNLEARTNLLKRIEEIKSIL